MQRSQRESVGKLFSMFLVNVWITLCSFPGLLKFCTVGFCGIGSLVDFMLISMQVRDFNFQVLAHLYLFTFPSTFFLEQSIFILLFLVTYT